MLTLCPGMGNPWEYLELITKSVYGDPESADGDDRQYVQKTDADGKPLTGKFPEGKLEALVAAQASGKSLME